MRQPLKALDQLEQLSECPYALLLGLNSEDDLIHRFLNFSRKLLGFEHGVLCFSAEPLMWYQNRDGLFATVQPSHQLSQYFQQQSIMTAEHSNHQAFSVAIEKLGLEHQRCIAVNLCKPDAESIGVVIFYDDATTKTVDQEQLELLQDYCNGFMRHIEMKFHFDELRNLYEEQCAQNFSKTKFFSIISHDLRAPFHGILGFSEILAKERDTLNEADVQNIAEYLYDTSQSTYNLLESLLNWAMAEGGRFVYHPVNFKLKQASSIVCQVLNSLAIKKNIQLFDHIDDDLKLYADINMMTSVIQNLVSNALKFTPMDGTGQVHIRAHIRADYQVEITVSDTGLGMTEAQLSSVFQPQIAVSFKGTAGEKGTGLGLTLCKRFVDLNHGKIAVRSREGQGTQFTVILPAVLEQIELQKLQLVDQSSQQSQQQPQYLPQSEQQQSQQQQTQVMPAEKVF